MTNFTQNNAGVFGGVDTHKDTHVAAVRDSLGRLLATASFPANPNGYCDLLTWLCSFGSVSKVGIEGTKSWGAGLTRYLNLCSIDTAEVGRANRQRRRLKGKSDTTDAEAAALAVINGEATAVPKSGDGDVEAIRVIRVALRSAIQTRTQVANQIHSLVDTAPDELREQLRDLTLLSLCRRANRFRPGKITTGYLAATKAALRHLARRWLAMSGEIKDLKKLQADLVKQCAPPALLATFGVGIDSAAALLIAIGDNPERFSSEAGFASLCGVSPMDASSGRNQRHRLNRGGDRQANSALWRIVVVRLRHDEATKAYMSRRLAEGKTKREVVRCLKRYLARSLWRSMNPKATDVPIVKEAA